MHHFGCVVPSYEALQVINHFAQGSKGKKRRAVLEMGSGNGYWTYILRRLGVEVQAVDNQQSRYRTTWIGDTIIWEGEKYLQDHGGCKEMILLMVYPIVGSNFTTTMLKAYRGDTVIIVGTQNANGYTAFKDKTITEYMLEEKKAFERKVQIPLPSFAGKDEGLFVFERRVGQ